MSSFNRVAMLEAVDAALTQDRVDREADYVRRQAAYTRAASEWVTRNGETWAQAARVIARRCKRGEPVLAQDIPTSHGTWPQVFSKAEPVFEYQPPRDLVVLREVLAIMADDTVAPSALRVLGVTPNALRSALRHFSGKA